MNKIKELRKECGWTQSQLGQKLNVKSAAISKYENGHIPLTAETIAMLCDIFSVSADYIIGRAEEKPSYDKQSFSETLKELRAQKNVTQDDMASLLNVKRQTYSAYERGVSFPDITALTKMAEFFGVTTDYLLGHKTSSTTEPLASNNIQSLIDSYSDLSEDEIKKVMEYVEFLKSKRND